jgi:hypothetical protein|tara:strand:- start:136 stop:1236 length:1101 start_codon:yes stop_codon:yes gene_type:complete
MSVDKKISYEKDKPAVQGGVENYLGRQPEVQAPRKWKSSPDKPETELAYITKAEKDLILKANIHGGLEKGPNMGPSGIMSLDSFGDIGGAGAAGVDTAASGEAMAGRGFSGKGPNETQSAFDARKRNQREILQKAEQRQAERLGYRERKNISDFKSRKPMAKFGMNILSGLMSLINPALGLFTRGINFFGDKLQDLRGYNPDGTPRTQAEYEKARLDRQLTNRLDNLYDRKLSGKNYSQKNIDMLEAMGVTTSKGNIKSAIERDIINEPEMPLFSKTYISSLAQPKVNTIVPPAKPSIKEGIQTIDVGINDPAFDNQLIADASYDQQKNVLENILNTEDTGVGEFIEDKEQKDKRQQELLNEIMTG